MILNESLDHLDLENIVVPTVSVDEYVAHMGDDKSIVTVAFTVKGEQAAQDLSSWFERGYDYVLDAKVSDGEIEPGKYLVFVEMNRRRTVPERIITLLADLKTLTGLSVGDWTVVVDDESYDANEDILKQVIITSPEDYKKTAEREDEMNEMRDLAGLDRSKIYEADAEIRNFINLAGL